MPPSQSVGEPPPQQQQQQQQQQQEQQAARTCFWATECSQAATSHHKPHYKRAAHAVGMLYVRACVCTAGHGHAFTCCRPGLPTLPGGCRRGAPECRCQECCFCCCPPPHHLPQLALLLPRLQQQPVAVAPIFRQLLLHTAQRGRSSCRLRGLAAAGRARLLPCRCCVCVVPAYCCC